MKIFIAVVVIVALAISFFVALPAFKSEKVEGQSFEQENIQLKEELEEAKEAAKMDLEDRLLDALGRVVDEGYASLLIEVKIGDKSNSPKESAPKSWSELSAENIVEINRRSGKSAPVPELTSALVKDKEDPAPENLDPDTNLEEQPIAVVPLDILPRVPKVD